MQHGKLNIIVMNAVIQACVHCHDIKSALRLFDEMSRPEGCGVDDVTYGTLLKVLKFLFLNVFFVVVECARFVEYFCYCMSRVYS